MKISFKSLYPSIMLEFNIAPNTQVGRIIISEKVYENENAYKIDQEKYSRSGEFVENLVTGNIVEYCKRWFHLAGVEEFIADIDEFYQDRNLGRYSNLVAAGFKSPIEPCSGSLETPIEFTQNKLESPIIFYNSKPHDLTYESLTRKGRSLE